MKNASQTLVRGDNELDFHIHVTNPIFSYRPRMVLAYWIWDTIYHNIPKHGSFLALPHPESQLTATQGSKAKFSMSFESKWQVKSHIEFDLAGMEYTEYTNPQSVQSSQGHRRQSQMLFPGENVAHFLSCPLPESSYGCEKNLPHAFHGYLLNLFDMFMISS